MGYYEACSRAAENAVDSKSKAKSGSDDLPPDIAGQLEADLLSHLGPLLLHQHAGGADRFFVLEWQQGLGRHRVKHARPMSHVALRQELSCLRMPRFTTSNFFDWFSVAVGAHDVPVASVSHFS